VKYRVIVEGSPYSIEIHDEGRILVDGVAHEVDLTEHDGQAFHSLLLDGRSYETRLRPSAAGVLDIVVKGRTHRTQLLAGATELGFHASTSGEAPASRSDVQAWLKAPLPGILVEARVERGDWVEPGDVVVVLESMKMHVELRAPQAGTVASLTAVAGQEVDLDEVLAIIVPGESDAHNVGGGAH
jgi:biotin carboxyl carrier protein